MATLSCPTLGGISPGLPSIFPVWPPQTESGLFQGAAGVMEWLEKTGCCSGPSPSLHCCCYCCSCLEDELRLPSRAPSQTLQGNSMQELGRLKLLCRNCCLLALSKSLIMSCHLFR